MIKHTTYLGYPIVAHITTAGGAGTAPGAYIVCYREHQNDYVTWWLNTQTDSASWGHYDIPDLATAVQDMVKRAYPDVVFAAPPKKRKLKLEQV